MKLVSKGPTDNIPALVQIMALCWPGDKLLSEPMMAILLMHICITLTQWVEAIFHYTDVIMSTMTSQITSLTIVYSTVYWGADQRKHQSSASLAFVQGIHRSTVNSLHKWPITCKMFADEWRRISHGCFRGFDVSWGYHIVSYWDIHLQFLGYNIFPNKYQFHAILLLKKSTFRC